MLGSGSYLCGGFPHILRSEPGTPSELDHDVRVYTQRQGVHQHPDQPASIRAKETLAGNAMYFYRVVGRVNKGLDNVIGLPRVQPPTSN